MENQKKNWLKSLIFEDVEPNDAPEQPVEKTDGQPATKTDISPAENIPAQVQTADSSNIVGIVDQKLLNKLCEVLDKQSVEGIDYLKFKKSVDSLRDFQPDENIRFTTAFITLKASTSSLTKDSLLQTIGKYIALMEEERMAGMNQLKELRGKSVDVKTKELNDAISRVDKLKEELKGLTAFISETDNEIRKKKNEFALQEANFNVTVDTIVNQMKEDKVKIETIIK